MSDSIHKVVADFETQLAAAISATDTTFTISSATDDSSVELADGVYCFTINRDGTNKEYLTGTLDASTKIVTAAKTITRQGVSSSGAALAHRVGETVSITNFKTLLDLAEQVGGEVGLDADSPMIYDAEPTLADRKEIATVAYVLDNVSGGTVSIERIIHAGNAGETVATPDILFLDTADQEWKKADADTLYGDDVQFGVAMGAGTDGAAITGGIALRGLVSGFTGLTAGATQYISATAGDLTESVPTNDIFAGVAVSTTEVLFNFENRIVDFLNSDSVTQAADLQTQTTSTNTIEVGEADTTTNKNSVAQSFAASKTKMKGVRLFKKADTGSFTGTVTVTLQADTAGAPSGSDLATVTISNANWALITDATEFEAIFSTEYGTLVIGDTYWIDVQPSTSDNSNHINLGADTSGGDGTVYYNNGTDGWVQLASSSLYYKTMEGNIAQVVKTNTSGFVPAALHKPQVSNVYTANDTWTKPADISYITVETVGGGGGGSGNTNSSSASAGGGGGGYSKEIFTAADLFKLTTVAVVVGAAGSTGSGSGGPGGTGGTSSFGTSLIQATGGSGGTTSTGGTGGIGTLGDINIRGGGGAGGASGGAVTGGSGGSSFFGGGAQGQLGTGNGNTGGVYGGGGSGAVSSGNDQSGGAGAAGVVIVTEFY